MLTFRYMYMYYISRVISNDPYNSQCLPIHIAVLVELKKAKGNSNNYPHFKFLGIFDILSKNLKQ